jgi:NADH:ubiquinone oxidoreductase subunit 2 (subunit N)
MDHETTTTMSMSGTQQTQLWNEWRREEEEGQLSRSFQQVHFDAFVVRCLLMISGLCCIWVSDTMRNSNRSGSSDSKFFSIFFFLTLYDYSSIHFECNVNDNEQVSRRARSRVVRVSVCMFLLSLSRFSTQNKGKKEWVVISFFSHFSIGFSVPFVRNNDALELIGLLLLLFLL